jgi:hypothetical protein
LRREPIGRRELARVVDPDELPRVVDRRARMIWRAMVWGEIWRRTNLKDRSATGTSL